MNALNFTVVLRVIAEKAFFADDRREALLTRVESAHIFDYDTYVVLWCLSS